MPHNRGTTSLKLKRRQNDAMREYDRLPPLLRKWLADAVMPWRPGSVRRAYLSALRRTQNPNLALCELDRLEARLVAKDAIHVWGPAHPASTKQSLIV